MGNTSTTSLDAWAKLPGTSLFDVDCWTIARAYSPVSHRATGFALFTTPLPYRVFYFRRLEDIARYLGRPAKSLVGTVYHDTDWAREVSGIATAAS